MTLLQKDYRRLLKEGVRPATLDYCSRECGAIVSYPVRNSKDELLLSNPLDILEGDDEGGQYYLIWADSQGRSIGDPIDF